MYLLFTENHTAENHPAIGDGSLLALTPCQEGWFCESKHKDIVDAQEWSYTEAKTITPIEPNNI